MQYFICSNSKGAALYFSLIIMAIFLALSLGISAIFINQINLIKEIGDSVLAFFAADTGIEDAMYRYYIKNQPLSFTIDNQEIGQSSYSVNAYAATADSSECPNPPNEYYCIKSFGTFREAKRAIEIFQ